MSSPEINLFIIYQDKQFGNLRRLGFLRVIVELQNGLWSYFRYTWSCTFLLV